MARIRTIKPDFWTDERLVECSLAARLFFIGLLNFADDNGNLQRSAKKLKMQIFPADSIDCEELIKELSAHRVIGEYSVNGELFLNIKNFLKHQVIDRPSKSNIPPPVTPVDNLPLVEDSTTEGKGREGKGKEIEGKGTSKSPPKSRVLKIPLPDGFEISDRVAKWAAEKGHDRMRERLEDFIGKAKAKGYSYVDWDEAFMNAIRNDWAGLAKGKSNGYVSAKDAERKRVAKGLTGYDPDAIQGVSTRVN